MATASISNRDVPPVGIEVDDIADEAALTIDYPSEPELSGRARRYNTPDSPQQVMYQRCGGGRRVIRKRIGD